MGRPRRPLSEGVREEIRSPLCPTFRSLFRYTTLKRCCPAVWHPYRPRRGRTSRSGWWTTAAPTARVRSAMSLRSRTPVSMCCIRKTAAKGWPATSASTTHRASTSAMWTRTTRCCRICWKTPSAPPGRRTLTSSATATTSSPSTARGMPYSAVGRDCPP